MTCQTLLVGKMALVVSKQSKNKLLPRGETYINSGKVIKFLTVVCKSHSV